MELPGLDAWIEGHGVCTYCGQYLPCDCEEFEDAEGIEEMQQDLAENNDD